jgi:hypothetical protein
MFSRGLTIAIEMTSVSPPNLWLSTVMPQTKAYTIHITSSYTQSRVNSLPTLWCRAYAERRIGFKSRNAINAKSTPKAEKYAILALSVEFMACTDAPFQAYRYHFDDLGLTSVIMATSIARISKIWILDNPARMVKLSKIRQLVINQSTKCIQ